MPFLSTLRLVARRAISRSNVPFATFDGVEVIAIFLSLHVGDTLAPIPALRPKCTRNQRRWRGEKGLPPAAYEDICTPRQRYQQVGAASSGVMLDLAR